MKELTLDNKHPAFKFQKRTFDEPTRINLPNAKDVDHLLDKAIVKAPVEIVAPKALRAIGTFNNTGLQAPVKLKSPYAGLFKDRGLFDPSFENSTFEGLGQTAKNLFNIYYSKEALDRFKHLGEKMNKTLEKLRKKNIYLLWKEDGDFSLEVAFYNIKTGKKYTPQNETERLIMRVSDMFTEEHTDNNSSVNFHFRYTNGEKFVDEISTNIIPKFGDAILGINHNGLANKHDLKALGDLYDFIKGDRKTVSSFADKTKLIKAILTKTKDLPVAAFAKRAENKEFTKVLGKVICK